MEGSPIPVRPIDELRSADASSIPAFPYPNPKSAADVLFTTGTTGEPKGVVLTHHNIYSAATNINAFIGNSSQDREVVPLPLSHSFGLGRLRCNLLAGGAIILVDGLTFPGQIFNAISQSKATGLSFVPAGLDLLLRISNDRLGDYVNQLRYVEIGSAPMSVEVKEFLMKLLPRTRICMHYGLTEASRAVFIEFHESARKLESVGKRAPNVEVKIFDPDTNLEAPENTLGKIMIRGGNVMQGYWKEPNRTQEVLKDGWLYTGDYGYRDHDGYFYLEGRERELINIGGRKVSPAEIERALQKHPDISTCACIGIDDPRGITGEAVKAYVVAKDPSVRRPDNSDIVEFLRESLEPYKVPVEFCWIDALPTTSSGKIQRSALRTISEGD